MMTIPIITDEVAQSGGWHGQVLQEAFAKRGVRAVFVDLNSCVMDFSDNDTPTIQIPGLDHLPPVAFVRGIAAGTLQQVITRLNFLHILRMLGCYVYNDAKAIERTVDKGMTTFLLKHHHIPTPSTWVFESRVFAEQFIQDYCADKGTLVAKPLFGSQGKGVRQIQHKDKIPLPGDLFVDGVYYLQRLIDTGPYAYDYRAFVVNHRVIAMMRRHGEGWLHNVAKGALCELCQEDDVAELAVAASHALQIDYCGVDLIRDRNGKLWVIEVNSIPAWAGLQQVCSLNIAQILVDDLLERIP